MNESLVFVKQKKTEKCFTWVQTIIGAAKKSIKAFFEKLNWDVMQNVAIPALWAERIFLFENVKSIIGCVEILV